MMAEDHPYPCDLIDELVERIKPILAGQEPIIQSCVLADLLAMWLAGHVGGDRKEVAEFRAGLLAKHMALVVRLIPVAEDKILGRRETRQ
jgi:hypothetical protein